MVAHLLEEQVKALEASIEVLRFGETQPVAAVAMPAATHAENVSVDEGLAPHQTLFDQISSNVVPITRRTGSRPSVEPGSIELFG